MRRLLPLVVAISFAGCDEAERAAKLEDAPEEAVEKDEEEIKIKPCVDGQTQECSVTLSEHNGIVSCYYGTQICQDGKWSECGGGEIVTQEVVEDPVSGLALQALGEQEGCTSNPCDPDCRTFVEEPEVPYQAVIVQPDYTWVEGQGGLADYPNGLVKKGYREPCEASDDCQFNMECRGPAKGTCSHSVCVAGAALEPDCSLCSERVCANHPECCTAPPPPPSSGGSSGGALPTSTSSCSHDPCVVGAGLNSQCNWCVNEICRTKPQCCNTTGTNTNWSAECAEAVVSVCGGSCDCKAGETKSGASCYTYHNKPLSWTGAKLSCQERSRWNLVTINDAVENDLISGIDPGQEKYIGLTEQYSEWRWIGHPTLGYFDEWLPFANMYVNWAVGQPDLYEDPDCVFINDNSTRWFGETACSSNAKADRRNYVCEGPGSVATLPAQPASGGGSTGGGSTPPPTTAEWTAACVAHAEAECGVVCDDAQPSNAKGVCARRWPGAVDETCDSVDLAVAIPCDGFIPICNHGTQDAEPPITLVHFPANSPQMPTTSPTMTHPEMVTCIINETIHSGECIAYPADDCRDNKGHSQQLGGNREIMINPKNLPSGRVDECDNHDNWSLYSHGSFECGPPACSGGDSPIPQETQAIDVIFVVDNSLGMASRIKEFEDRLNDRFVPVLEASNVDYRIILISRYGDHGTPIGTSASPVCIGAPVGGQPCLDPMNETLTSTSRFFHVSTDVESWDSWCGLLHGFDTPDEVATLDTSAFGMPGERPWTPRFPDGWSKLVRADAFKAFVVLTDDDADCDDWGYDFDDSPECEGFPHDCHDRISQEAFPSNVEAGKQAAEKFDVALRELSPEQFGTTTLDRKYAWHSILNIRPSQSVDAKAWAPSAPIQSKMCTPEGTSIVGAGTGYQALSQITGGSRYPICDTNEFAPIFDSIASKLAAKATASCQFNLPEPVQGLDPDAAVAYYTEGDGTQVPLTLYPAAGNCGSATRAWHYLDPNDPRELILCPETCAEVKKDKGAKVWYRMGCPGGEAEETSYDEVYEATCGIGKLPTWTFLGYDTTTPSDGAVTFYVRTANTREELSVATWVEVAHATSTYPDCAIAPSSQPNCPVDLYQILGPDMANAWMLEVRFTITPTSDNISPMVQDWSVNFTCPDGE